MTAKGMKAVQPPYGHVNNGHWDALLGMRNHSHASKIEFIRLLKRAELAYREALVNPSQ